MRSKLNKLLLPTLSDIFLNIFSEWYFLKQKYNRGIIYGKLTLKYTVHFPWPLSERRDNSGFLKHLAFQNVLWRILLSWHSFSPLFPEHCIKACIAASFKHIKTPWALSRALFKFFLAVYTGSRCDWSHFKFCRYWTLHRHSPTSIMQPDRITSSYQLKLHSPNHWITSYFQLPTHVVSLNSILVLPLREPGNLHRLSL